MEKDGSLGGNPRADFNWAAQGMEMNLDSAGNSSFLNLNNWEQSPAHDAQAANFESALSSFVSSPTTTTSAAACNNPSPDSIVIRELIGRLGSICNNNNSSSSSNYQSTSSSCYATPLSSPPKLNISIPQFPPPTPMGVDFVTDSGFAERAARYSCFGAARNYAQFGELSSGQSLKENDMTRMMMMMSRPDWDLGLNANNCVKSSNARDDSPPSDRIVTPSSEGNVGRKRKATFSSSSSSSKGSRGGRNDAHHNPPKASEDEKSKSKRCKPSSAAEAKGDDKETVKAPNVEQKNSAAEKQNGKDKESNAEHPKQDYIHVRARRGQATDSHSLAERVRREKISERMKFLQDLVPGCNKVTGKAVMLDEIINYVQALQGQVEFLSMKLATVNPQMDQPRGPMLPPQSSYPLEATTSCGFSYGNQPQGQGPPPPLQSLMGSNAALETQLDPSYLNLDGFTDHATSAPQPGAFWEDDLHSVVQMGFVQNHAVSSHNLQGAPGPTRDMKLEL